MRKALIGAAIAAAMTTTAPASADDAKKPTESADTKPMSDPHDDLTFAVHMAHHHRDGIAMADHVIAEGSDPAVAKLAKRIRADQLKELAILDRVAKRSDKQARGEAEPPKDHDMEREMARLNEASGNEADRLFLEQMITHHAQALIMARSALPHLSASALRKMAKQAFAKQAREIGELYALHEAVTRQASR